MVLTTCTSTLLDWPWITVLGVEYPLDCLDSLLDGLESTPYPTPSRPTSSLALEVLDGYHGSDMAAVLQEVIENYKIEDRISSF
jgi:hypothetical protein